VSSSRLDLVRVGRGLAVFVSDGAVIILARGRTLPVDCQIVFRFVCTYCYVSTKERRRVSWNDCVFFVLVRFALFSLNVSFSIRPRLFLDRIASLSFLEAVSSARRSIAPLFSPLRRVCVPPLSCPSYRGLERLLLV